MRDETVEICGGKTERWIITDITCPKWIHFYVGSKDGVLYPCYKCKPDSDYCLARNKATEKIKEQLASTPGRRGKER